VCISLTPSYLVQAAKSEEAEGVTLDHKTVLLSIAKEIYQEEFFNLGFDPETKAPIRPPFELFVESLGQYVLLFKYSRTHPSVEVAPSIEKQMKFVEEEMEDFKYDFLPKKRNIVYHIVSAEWFKVWQRYVGIT
jgi:hypothetical protein